MWNRPVVTYSGSYEEAPSGMPDLLPDEVLNAEWPSPPPSCRLCDREEVVVDIEIPETYFDNGARVVARYWPLCSGCLALIDRRDSRWLLTRLEESFPDEEEAALVAGRLLDGARHRAQ